MIHISVLGYFFVFPLIFLAGAIDSIAGGGGLISLPTYLFVGLPPHLALGTNKFSSFFGTVFSTIRYFRSKMIDIRIALTTAFAALIGSWLGTKTVLMINPDFLNYILIFLIPIITVINLLNKNVGMHDLSSELSINRKYVLVSIAGIVIGFYDGFFGPGTGAFLILFYTILLKYNFIVANGNSKVVNLASNFAAVVTFAVSGSIFYKLAIPAALCGILGNIIGSRLVVLRGNKLIKKIFIIVLFLLMIKVIWNVISK